MLYKGLKGAASIPTNDLSSPTPQSGIPGIITLAFQTPLAGTDMYMSSFFPQSIRDQNSPTDSLISVSERAEESATEFTSLVRARD